VQSVAVRLVCDREREIEAFKPQEYWDIFADLTPGGEEQAFRAKLVEVQGAKAKVENGEQAAAIAADARTQAYHVARVKRSDNPRRPLPPFITSTLQQEASARLGMAPRRTMMVAQQLYEGLELGAEGSVGLITYMRTDSTRVAQEAQADARAYVADTFGGDYLPERPRQFAARKGAQEAHEAIRPTEVARHPDAIAQHLDRDQLRLYRLIWSRFLASQMADAVLDVMVVDAAGGRYLFRVTGQAVKFPGFMRVYSPSKAQAEEGGEINLPAVQEGQALELIGVETAQKFTQPPPRYTEASLVRALEAKGIGRPSTYAPILATIRDRGYVYLDERRLRPTDLGYIVTDQLSAHFPRIMDVGFTADVEEQLDQVEQGKSDWVQLLRDFYGPFAESLGRAEEHMGAVRLPARETEEKCPQCEKPLLIRVGRHGPFLACSGYPQCRYTRPVAEPNEGSEGDASAAPTRQCPECGEPLVVRRSRRGPFLGCSGYPKCRHVEPLAGGAARRSAKEPPQPTGEACDKCGKPMVMRSGRRGRFAGCSGYPKCRNTRPLAESQAGDTTPVRADISEAAQ
jgi:DNA topoisomerase-1